MWVAKMHSRNEAIAISMLDLPAGARIDTLHRLLANRVCHSLTDTSFCPGPDVHDCWNFPCPFRGEQT